MMKVRGIKLLTGEELIAKIMHLPAQAANTTAVEDPLVVQMGMKQDGSLMCQFIPWTIITDQHITINDHAIVAEYEVSADVEKAYLKRVSSIEIVADPATASTILHG